MISLCLGILIRIFSNSYLNVFQKLLTNNGEKSSVINFYTYFGLSILGLISCSQLFFSVEILKNIIAMGFLGAAGNYCIIKALSQGELSTLAPINSYKPVVALFFAFIYLREIPQLAQVIGIILIIVGTFMLGSNKILYNKATLYRFLALIFSAIEAVFIKKIILLTNIEMCFLYWALAGLFFASIFVLFSRHSIKIQKHNIKYQVLLIFLVALMQYSTNYVFSRMNVAYALALFQLSTLLSVFLGIKVFKEDGFCRKMIASLIMLLGAGSIILF